jgi:hypothetical protein
MPLHFNRPGLGILPGFALVAALVTAGPAAAADITYALDKPGQVSLLLTDATGAVVRELLHAAKRDAGPITESWDGRDDSGRPVAAGTYGWKLLQTQGLGAEYLMTLGTNPGEPWLPWPGNHGAVNAVAADADGIYFGGSCGEGTPLLVKEGWDDRRQWSIPHWLDAWQGVWSMAALGETLYILSAGKVYRYHRRTGVSLGRPWTGADVAGGWLAAGANQLVIASGNRIAWLDPATGAVVDQVAVPTSRGVAIAPSGQIYTIVQGAVVTLTQTAKTPVVVVAATALRSPWCLAADPQSGDILVAENDLRAGMPANVKDDNFTPAETVRATTGRQVKRFSSTGRLLGAYGLPGGRKPLGRYAGGSFCDIRSLCALPDGGFVVAEPTIAPRRTARFDRNGTLVREWYGGQQYSNFAVVQPGDPSTVWMDSHWGELIKAKVDYAKRTWTVHSVYHFGDLAGLVPGTTHGGGRWHPVVHAGRTYLFRTDGPPCVLRVNDATCEVTAVTVAMMNLGHYWTEAPPSVRALIGTKANSAQKASLLWADRNGDGQTSPDEIEFNPWTAWWGSWTVDGEGNYYTAGRILRVTWDAAGLPHYPKLPWSTNAEVFQKTWPALPPWPDGRGNSIWREVGGPLYGAFNTDGAHPAGRGGWGSRVGGNRLVKWNADGSLAWVVGRHALGDAAAPGEAKFFWRIYGTTHGCVVASDVENGYAHVWDADGLWVGRLLERPATGSPAGAYQLCGENFHGSLHTDPKTGEVLYFGGTTNSTNVFRITGWNDFKRQHGSVTITPAQVAQSADVATPGTDLNKPVRVPALDRFVLDGDLAKWRGIAPLEIRDGAEVRAKVFLGRDGGDLCATFDVTTDRPWKSSGVASVPFEGGAAVDLSFGPWAPERTAAGPGDTRIVVAPIGGQTRMFELVQVLPPGQEGTAATFTTGNGTVVFGRLATCPDSRVFARVRPGGYIVDLRVPLALKPGTRLRLDASVTLADPTATRGASRLTWHSRDAGDMMMQDVYQQALLRPKNWGEIVIE